LEREKRRRGGRETREQRRMSASTIILLFLTLSRCPRPQRQPGVRTRPAPPTTPRPSPPLDAHGQGGTRRLWGALCVRERGVPAPNREKKLRRKMRSQVLAALLFASASALAGPNEPMDDIAVIKARVLELSQLEPVAEAAVRVSLVGMGPEGEPSVEGPRSRFRPPAISSYTHTSSPERPAMPRTGTPDEGAHPTASHLNTPLFPSPHPSVHGPGRERVHPVPGHH
jgi:hypothetical protein